jgi:hypothetical protein
MARTLAVAALLLLCAVAAQASRFHVEESENGRLLMQAGKAPNCTKYGCTARQTSAASLLRFM